MNNFRQSITNNFPWLSDSQLASAIDRAQQSMSRLSPYRRGNAAIHIAQMIQERERRG